MLQAPYFYDHSTPNIVFGLAVNQFRFLWRKLHEVSNARWKVGSLEIALDEDSLNVINRHKEWANKYCPDENLQYLSSDELRNLEPNIRGAGAIYSLLDAAVDYSELSQYIGELALKRGAQFLANTTVISIKENLENVTVEIIDQVGHKSMIAASYLMLQAQHR